MAELTKSKSGLRIRQVQGTNQKRRVCPADWSQVANIPVVSPFDVARIEPVVGRGGIVGADEVVDAADDNVDDAGKSEDE